MMNSKTDIAMLSDMNGDGTIELLIGAPGGDTAYLLEANTTGGAENASWYWQTSESNTLFGQVIVPVGDIDSDGLPDAVVGAPNFDGIGSNKGGIFLLSSTQIGLSHDPTGEFI